MSIPELSYGDILDRVDLGGERAIIWTSDGEIRFRHICGGTHTPMIIAPRLQIGQGHTIVTRYPLTIVASIACDLERGCLEHGFVTGGRWVPA